MTTISDYFKFLITIETVLDSIIDIRYEEELEVSKSVPIRKDFPDTWIWKEINEEG